MPKNKKWIKPRHRVVTALARAVLGPFSRIKYGIKVEKFKEQNGRQYLVLYNHQTAFDQFFVGLAFKGPIYYLASEDLFSKGWISSVIKYIVAPIPIKKQSTDVQAVMKCMKVAKEGGTIAIAPEGNRTFSGKTEYINPAIIALAKKMKLPIAIYKIEGGYGVHPRWSDCIRKGKMRAGVSRVIEPEYLSTVSNEELLAEIERDLFVDDTKNGGTFLSNHKAEYMERAFYVCHNCGLSTFISDGNHLKCKKCNSQIEYTDTLELKSEDNSFPFKTTTEWYEYQCKFVNSLDLSLYVQSPIYVERADFIKVIPCVKREALITNGELSLYGDRITVKDAQGSETVLNFANISAISVVGRNKLDIYYGGDIYQLKSNKRFNALKYANLFYRYLNSKDGERYGQFLGL